MWFADVPLRRVRSIDTGETRAAVALRDHVIPFQRCTLFESTATMFVGPLVHTAWSVPASGTVSFTHAPDTRRRRAPSAPTATTFVASLAAIARRSATIFFWYDFQARPS